MGKQTNKQCLHTFPSSKEILSDQELNISNASSSTSSSISSSSDFTEDASSPSSSSSSSSNGSLYQWSDLMDQLPIKRGLSKYYQGKSQSFAAVTSVENLEELAKKANPYNNKRMKMCKSFSTFTSPKGSIMKKASQKSCYSSSIVRRNCSNNFMVSCRLPTIHVHKDF